MNPNDPVVHIEREIPRIESMALAIFNRNGPAFQQFLSSQPPADLDIYRLHDLSCVFIRVGCDEKYVNWLADNADIMLDTIGFRVVRYKTEAMANCPPLSVLTDPSYTLVVECLQEDKELKAVLPMPLDYFWGSLHKLEVMEAKLRQALINLGVHPGPETARIEEGMLSSERSQINDAWSYAMRLDKNIKHLRAQVEQTEKTHRNNKLIHLAKIVEQYFP